MDRGEEGGASDGSPGLIHACDPLGKACEGGLSKQTLRRSSESKRRRAEPQGGQTTADPGCQLSGMGGELAPQSDGGRALNMRFPLLRAGLPVARGSAGHGSPSDPTKCTLRSQGIYFGERGTVLSAQSSWSRSAAMATKRNTQSGHERPPLRRHRVAGDVPKIVHGSPATKHYAPCCMASSPPSAHE